MDVYGLTGGIGSGKSAVAILLEEYGVPVVSADELSRVVVAKGSDGLADVVARFGNDVIDDVGELDRRKMASIVFQDPAKRRELEAILHPRIRERFEQVLDALEKAGHEVAVYEVPLLFEKNLQGDMKAVILVAAPEAVRVARVRSRDDITETEVRARIAAQMDESIKRKRADYIIENDGTLDDLQREVEFLLARFLRIYAPRRPDVAETSVSATPGDRRTEIPIGPPPGADTGPVATTATATMVPASARRTEVDTGPPVPAYGMHPPTPPAGSPVRPPMPGVGMPTRTRSQTMVAPAVAPAGVPQPPVPASGQPPPGIGPQHPAPGTPAGVPSPPIAPPGSNPAGVPSAPIPAVGSNPPGAPQPQVPAAGNPTPVPPARSAAPRMVPAAQSAPVPVSVPRVPLPGASRSGRGRGRGDAYPAVPVPSPAPTPTPLPNPGPRQRTATMISPPVDRGHTQVAPAIPVAARPGPDRPNLGSARPDAARPNLAPQNPGGPSIEQPAPGSRPPGSAPPLTTTQDDGPTGLPTTRTPPPGGTMRAPAVGTPEFERALKQELADADEQTEPDTTARTQIAPAVVPKPPKKG